MPVKPINILKKKAKSANTQVPDSLSSDQKNVELQAISPPNYRFHAFLPIPSQIPFPYIYITQGNSWMSKQAQGFPG